MGLKTVFFELNPAEPFGQIQKNQYLGWSWQRWHRRGRKFNPCHAHHFSQLDQPLSNRRQSLRL